jgi:hypothetical protein
VLLARHSAGVFPGGNENAWDPIVAQPHSLKAGLLAVLSILNKQSYTRIPHLGVKVPLNDGLLFSQLEF